MIIGFDIGGTSARGVLVDEGMVLNRIRTAGGNPVATGAEAAGQRIESAVRSLLADHDPAQVAVAVFGVAGAEDDPAAVGAIRRAAVAAGLTCEIVVVPDTVAALAAATHENEGTVLVAGTGAVAVHVRAGAIVAIADGHGWLLGDAGSGFWLGAAAARVLLDRIDRGESLEGLPADVLSALDIAEPERHAVIAALYADPLRLPTLAPLVLTDAERGDAVAEQLVEHTVEALVGSLTAARPAAVPTPIVLVGGIATSPLIAGRLATAAHQRWPGAEVYRVDDASEGAARIGLAVRRTPEGGTGG